MTNQDEKARALLPCPFCGGEANVEQEGSMRQSTIYACTECGCRLETGEVLNIGDRWNRRAPSNVETMRVSRAAMQNYLTDHPHSKPHDCYATGPVTGNAIYDLIRCPGCTAESEMTAAIAKIDAALASPAPEAEPAAVKVKPLEWREPTDHSEDDEGAVAHASGIIGGRYSITDEDNHFLLWDADFVWRELSSVEDAKAAAQADYERRILSCLDTVSARQIAAEERERCATLAEAIARDAERDATAEHLAHAEYETAWNDGACLGAERVAQAIRSLPDNTEGE